MFSFRSLLAIAPLAALAYAQSKVAFTSLPASIDAGSTFNITWAGGDGSPVTLTLRRGNPNDLDTVSTIASNVDEYYYVWNVPSTLPSGADYAFQITQGQSDINWTGLFSINGASASASNSTTTASTAASTTRAGNSTVVMTSMGSASGTGTAMQRNTTFSSASLTSQGAFTFSSASSTSSHSSSTRASSTSASATSTPSNDASTMAGSSAALIMGLVAAMMLH